MTGLDCVRCGEAFEPGDDRDAAVCGPCLDEGPVTPRPTTDVACLVGPDDDPVARRAEAAERVSTLSRLNHEALKRIGIAAARIDEPDGSDEWDALTADLDRVFDEADDGVLDDDLPLRAVIRELLLRAWECGGDVEGDEDPWISDGALRWVNDTLADVRSDVAGVRESLRDIRMSAHIPGVAARMDGELNVLDARLADIEAACADTFEGDC